MELIRCISTFLEIGKDFRETTLDIKDVSLVSLSYVDELIGKLIEEIGFVKFMAFFSAENISPINETMTIEALKRHFNIGQ